MTRRPACGEQDRKLPGSEPGKTAVVNNPVAFAPLGGNARPTAYRRVSTGADLRLTTDSFRIPT